MPNIVIDRRRGDGGRNPRVTLDDLRREPGALMFAHHARALGLADSYDGLKSLVKSGKLPEPYRIGNRPAWEARAFLRAIGASPTIPD